MPYLSFRKSNAREMPKGFTFLQPFSCWCSNFTFVADGRLIIVAKLCTNVDIKCKGWMQPHLSKAKASVTSAWPLARFGTFLLWMDIFSENKKEEKTLLVKKWHLFLKQGSLFCFVLFCLSHWDFPNQNTLCHTLGIFGKLSMSRGAPTWFETVWSYGVEAIDYWTIFSLKIK